MVDNIGSISGGGAVPPNNPFFLIQEYKDLYIQFLHSGTPPSKEAAQALLTFLKANQSVLEQLGSMVGYQPYPTENFDDDLTALMNHLDAYVHGKDVPDPSYEFARDIAQWLGINYTPQEILNDFESLIKSFENNPNIQTAQYLDWFLSTPGYLKALGAFAKNPIQFQVDAEKAQAAVRAYLADPGEGAAQAQAALEKIFNDL